MKAGGIPTKAPPPGTLAMAALRPPPREAGPPREARVWSADEQKEKLASYTELDKALWAQIRKGAHVRYYTAEGDFRTGGFVREAPGLSREGKQYFQMHNNLNEKALGYTSWVVLFDSISRLYIKADVVVLALQASVEAMAAAVNSNFKKLDARIRAIEQAVAALKREPEPRPSPRQSPRR